MTRVDEMSRRIQWSENEFSHSLSLEPILKIEISESKLYHYPKSEGVKTDKTIDISGVCPTLTLPVAEIKMERAKGFEPSTFTLAT